MSIIEKFCLKMKFYSTGEITETKYKAGSMKIMSLCVRSDREVIAVAVGLEEDIKVFPTQDRGVVIVMDQESRHKKVFEHDAESNKLFSLPWRITCTKNNIFILDTSNEHVGRVVVLSGEGSVLNTYTGYTENEKPKPLTPTYITSTPSDRVTVCDNRDQSFHIMSNSGHLSYISGSSIGVKWTYCMDFVGGKTLYLGNAPPNDKLKHSTLYLVNFQEL